MLRRDPASSFPSPTTRFQQVLLGIQGSTLDGLRQEPSHVESPDLIRVLSIMYLGPAANRRSLFFSKHGRECWVSSKIFSCLHRTDYSGKHMAIRLKTTSLSLFYKDGQKPTLRLTYLYKEQFQGSALKGKQWSASLLCLSTQRPRRHTGKQELE